MQDAVPVGTGAMAAILGLDAQKVIEGCAEARAPAGGEVVEAANFNDPSQTVIAGSKAGVDKACELLKADGREARAAAARLARLPLEPDEARGRKAEGSCRNEIRVAAHSGDQQH